MAWEAGLGRGPGGGGGALERGGSGTKVTDPWLPLTVTSTAFQGF